MITFLKSSLKLKTKNKLKLFYIIPTILSILILAISLSYIYRSHAVINHPLTNSNSIKDKIVYDGVVGKVDHSRPVSIDSQSLLDDTNNARVENKVAPLKSNTLLTNSAAAKCADMITRNYWSHDTPDGKKPWTFIAAAGYDYYKSAENLAYGFSTSNDVVTGWMNSEEHRMNLLDKDLSDVGFAVCYSNNFAGLGDETVVVQHFGTIATQIDKAPVSKPYFASVCTKTVIPYTTIVQDNSYLYTDQSTEYGGSDGYLETCTADSTGYKPPDFTYPQISKMVIRGTMVRPVYSPVTP